MLILLIIYIDSPLTQANINRVGVSILYNISMSEWIFLIVEFTILFVTSRFIFKSLFAFLYVLFRSQKVAISLLSFLFLPGVFIHEMAHLLMAELLQVRTHGIEFVPELSGNSLKMGSVQVEQTDIVRRLLIGIAPLVVGGAIIVGALMVLANNFSYSTVFASGLSVIVTVVAILVIFMISNTMFSSTKDIEGLFEFLFIIAILFGALYFTGLRPHEFIYAIALQPKVVEVIGRINWLMVVPVGINMTTVIISIPLLRKLKIV